MVLVLVVVLMVLVLVVVLVVLVLVMVPTLVLPRSGRHSWLPGAGHAWSWQATYGPIEVSEVPSFTTVVP